MSPVIRCISLSPATLTRMVDQVKPERYTDRLPDEKDGHRFSLVEMVAHLADFEQIFLDRMVLAYEAPGSVIEGIDVDARAVEKHYGSRDIHHELEVFENRRRDTMAFLETLKPEDYAKSVTHPTFGEFSIQDFVETIAGHDIYHLEQASHYMR